MTCYPIPSHLIDRPPFPLGEMDQGQADAGPQVTPKHRRQEQMCWKVAIAASLTVPLATATALQVFDVSPNYEGRIQLVELLPPSVSPSTPTAAATPVLTTDGRTHSCPIS